MGQTSDNDNGWPDPYPAVFKLQMALYDLRAGRVTVPDPAAEERRIIAEIERVVGEHVERREAVTR